jgi:flagellar basal-body rod protein FlgB
MLNNLTASLDFHAKALALRGVQQQTLAANIANADTPGYVAQRVPFQQAMQAAMETQGGYGALQRTQAGHMPNALQGTEATLQDTNGVMPSQDGNTVDLDQERARFASNALHYEATLRFINGSVRTMLSAIQGQ